LFQDSSFAVLAGICEAVPRRMIWIILDVPSTAILVPVATVLASLKAILY
jgi:hypothetical protein